MGDDQDEDGKGQVVTNSFYPDGSIHHGKDVDSTFPPKVEITLKRSNRNEVYLSINFPVANLFPRKRQKEQKESVSVGRRSEASEQS